MTITLKGANKLFMVMWELVHENKVKEYHETPPSQTPWNVCQGERTDFPPGLD